VRQTRRQFLVHTGCGALSAAALVSGLGRFALIDALAQSVPGDYKALVCVFLLGGNDANNVVIPYTNYSDYSNVRGGAQFAIPQADLLQINPPSTPGLTFGLNPRLGDAFMTNPSLYDLWNSALTPPRPPAAAIVCNVGPLIFPVTRDQYRAGLGHPYQLLSHSDQQNLWQSAYATGPRQTGWGGLTAEKTGGSGGNFPTISSIAGVTVFSTGQNTRPLVLSPAPTTLGQSLRLLRMNDQQAILDALTADGQDPMPTLIRGAAQITQNALDVSIALGSSDPPLTTLFPNTSLGNQLKQVAKVMSFIKNTPSLGVNRQIFFALLGGFDTHIGQGQFGTNNGQLGLLSQVSQAIGSLYQATVELSLQNQVTIFTSSDFSRTFVPGGGQTGTDHAWGSHQFVVGGAVNGGNFYGQYPALVLGDVLDIEAGSGARGRWIPTTSVDQYAATLANWYGLAASDRTLVFTNIGNFSPQTLDFMAVGPGPAQARRGTARS
jgi:uncharacterized protein (DUF1501 family)